MWKDVYLCKFGLITAEEKATNAILCIDVIVILYKSVPEMGQSIDRRFSVIIRREPIENFGDGLTLCRAIWDDQ